MNARRAAAREGWLEVFGYWFFTDLLRWNEYERPLYFRGTAVELCLTQGILFSEL